MRTDIHRPSADVDPAQYRYLDSFDLSSDLPGDAQDLEDAIHRLIDQGVRYSGAHGAGRCDHCGAWVRYASIMIHEKTNSWIWFGARCVETFSRTAASDLKLRRKAAEQARKEAKLAAGFAAACQEQPALTYATYATNIGAADPGTYWTKDIITLGDIVRRCRSYGSAASPKQLALIETILDRMDQRQARHAAFAAERAVQRAEAEPVPSGRVIITGEVIKVNWQDNDFGGRLVMTVKDDRGFLIWSSIPRKLTQDEQGHLTIDSVVKPGERVTFTATVSPSERDPYFGFAKNPAKASRLSPVSP